jgi:hypothetical protein
MNKTDLIARAGLNRILEAWNNTAQVDMAADAAGIKEFVRIIKRITLYL